MASDIARRSYDRSRKYTGVVPQQGRVTIESDQNEAREIAGEELSLRTLHVVGPQGSPDLEPASPPSAVVVIEDAATRAIAVVLPTIYVGGQRVDLDTPVRYADQVEWLDGPDAFDANTGLELVYLQLDEHEVSAVEDAALQEIALGGPDTAARTRIRRRVRRAPSATADCGAVWTEDGAWWTARGLHWSAATMEVLSLARLQVVLGDGEEAEDKCAPAAEDGYLGADNQLVRVMVVATEPGGTGDAVLWSYDNASSLYRVASVSADGKTLTLASRPVDDEHHPKKGRYVEALRAGVHFGGDDYAATTEVGLVTRLAEDYGEDDGTLTLAQSVGAASDEAPRFVRVWENLLPIDTAGLGPDGYPAVELTRSSGESIGVSVRISLATNIAATADALSPGSFWMFAVRPGAPQAVYPKRYALAGQPPDGPRRWACPLAMVRWTGGAGEVVAPPCVKPFHNLVELTAEVNDLEIRVTDIEVSIQNIWVEIDKLKKQRGGCCTLTVDPGLVGGGATFGGVLEELAEVLAKENRVTLCLKAGVYRLPRPLYLGPKHKGLTIEACGGGAVLTVAKDAAWEELVHGLVIAVEASDVTLRGITFKPGDGPLAEADRRLAGVSLEELERHGLSAKGLRVSIGLRAVACPRLTVESCVFEVPTNHLAPMLGAGVLAHGDMSGFTARRCVFHAPSSRKAVVFSRARHTYGILVTPATALEPLPAAEILSRGKAVRGRTLAAELSGADIADCTFENLSAAVVALASLGEARVRQSRARGVASGVWLLSSATVGVVSELMSTDDTPELGSVSSVAALVAVLMANPTIRDGTAIARGLALPEPARHLVKPIVYQPAAVGTKGVFPKVLGALASAQSLWGSAAAADVKALQDRWRQLSGANALHHALSKLELAALGTTTSPATARRPGLVLFASGNDIDATLAVQPSGPALVAFDIERDAYDAGIIGENRLRNGSDATPTAVLLLLRSGAVTGNLIFNQGSPRDKVQPYLAGLSPEDAPETEKQVIAASYEQEDLLAFPLEGLDPVGAPEKALAASASLKRPSLVAVPGASDDRVAPTAVTGNVFLGRPLLPRRVGFSSPFDTWLIFNTVTP